MATGRPQQRHHGLCSAADLRAGNSKMSSSGASRSRSCAPTSNTTRPTQALIPKDSGTSTSGWFWGCWSHPFRWPGCLERHEKSSASHSSSFPPWPSSSSTAPSPTSKSASSCLPCRSLSPLGHRLACLCRGLGVLATPRTVASRPRCGWFAIERRSRHWVVLHSAQKVPGGR